MSADPALEIVIPIFNDWESASRLLPMVDEQLKSAGVAARVLLVDDGSTTPCPAQWNLALGQIKSVQVLRLKRNMGHQRAIGMALCYLCEESTCEQVLVMDGDGEDAPSDIPRLLSALKANPEAQIVFAERRKRSEGWIFTLFYGIYRYMHWLLVGHRVRVGNFSVMRRECLESLCVSSELWNHFAAAVFATKQPKAFVSTNRATRLAGQSSMNYPALVMHGLSALSVFSDRISTRLLITSVFGVFATMAALIVVALIRFTTGYAIPGWATNAVGFLTLFSFQIVTFIFTFCFLVLLTRGQSPFIPVRDYRYFVLRVREVFIGTDE